MFILPLLIMVAPLSEPIKEWNFDVLEINYIINAESNRYVRTEFVCISKPIISLYSIHHVYEDEIVQELQKSKDGYFLIQKKYAGPKAGYELIKVNFKEVLHYRVLRFKKFPPRPPPVMVNK